MVAGRVGAMALAGPVRIHGRLDLAPDTTHVLCPSHALHPKQVRHPMHARCPTHTRHLIHVLCPSVMRHPNT